MAHLLENLPFRLVDMPLEIVIEILAIAARDAVDGNRGWLCGLARTSKISWLAVKPILYETVDIDYATCVHVLSAMRRSTNFLATRHLLIDTLSGEHERFSASIPAVARAFENVTDVACSQGQLCRLMAAHERFRPSRLTCIGQFKQEVWSRAATDLPYLRGITHISTNIGSWLPAVPLPELPFTHVVILLHPGRIDHILPWFLASKGLQRISVWDLWGTTDWTGLLRAFAGPRRERRIWLLAHAECSRIAQLEINRRGLGVYRPMVTFEDSLWAGGTQIS
ncbi:hypothetical protein AURDEDRAFT_122211 [Auricularia subglabra TFB-10046 SS5]|nr:hypothetical protein AURDEDRAFT_122211 [Auricularia subglabra TFB-10046 SS5]